MFKYSKNTIKGLQNNLVTIYQTDGRTDRWIDKRTEGESVKSLKSLKKKCINDMKTFKNIRNVFELGVTTFKQVCEEQTDRQTDELTD